jgi:hypothetical protein
MEAPHIPRDDIIDVEEMTKKIESYICYVLQDNQRNLAMSALMTATINCMLAQCKTFDEVLFYRNIFMQIFDETIKNIEIRDPG